MNRGLVASKPWSLFSAAFVRLSLSNFPDQQGGFGEAAFEVVPEPSMIAMLGIGGLMGAGRSELLMHLFGIWGDRLAGSVQLENAPLASSSCGQPLRQRWFESERYLSGWK